MNKKQKNNEYYFFFCWNPPIHGRWKWYIIHMYETHNIGTKRILYIENCLRKKPITYFRCSYPRDFHSCTVTGRTSTNNIPEKKNKNTHWRDKISSEYNCLAILAITWLKLFSIVYEVMVQRSIHFFTFFFFTVMWNENGVRAICNAMWCPFYVSN